MKKLEIIEKIESAMSQAQKAQQRSDAYAFLPEIIDSLAAMRGNLEQDRERRSKMAGALERLVTEDFVFSESRLGSEILELAEEFALL